ncbi:MAG: radical SAM protein [Dehalococcoidia bacterium]
MNVAFIAMSGVRAFNEDLVLFGWSLPGFAERAATISSLPSLGLLTLAGMTPDPHEVSYHEIADLKSLAKLPECDIATISTLTAQANDAYALADRYRELGVPVVLGGLHATALPDEAARHADSVVVGEGELSWPSVLEDLSNGRLKSRYEPCGREFDLAESPMPRFDLLDPVRYNRLTVQTQRGCPWRCQFCASSIMLTRHYKVKPVERVVAEIHAIKRVWPKPFIEFADDNTFVNKAHSRKLMRALADEDLRWFTETDIGVADDPELLKLIHDAGCAQLLIGLESPTADGVGGVELRQDWKRKQAPKYREAIQRIQGAGITVNGCFVLGLDTHGPEAFDSVAEFVEESGLAEVQITVQTPLPGSGLYDRLKQEGRLLYDGEWDRFTLFDVTFEPRGMTVAALEQGLRDLGARLFTPEARRERVHSFMKQARAGRRASKAGAS